MNLGKIKVLIDRARNYMQLLNTLMIAVLFIQQSGWRWWYLLILSAFVVWSYIDNKKVIGQERDYIWSRPGTLNDMVENIKFIKEKIENGHFSGEVHSASKTEKRNSV